MFALVAFLSVGNVHARSELISKYINGRNIELKHEIEFHPETKSCTRYTIQNDKYRYKPTTSAPLKGSACQVYYAAEKLQNQFGACTKQRVEISESGSKKNYTSTSMNLSESCLCTKNVYKKRSIGLGSLNILENLFNGSYWKDEWASYTTTAKECAQFFPEESQKQFVLQTYKEFGIK